MDLRADAAPSEDYLNTALAALRSLPDASVSVFDRDLRYVLVAGKMVSQAGYDPGAMEGQLVADVLAADRWDIYAPLYRAALRGEASTVEVQSLEASRWYRVEIGPWSDESGAVAGGIAVARDVTQRRRVQARLEGLLESAPDAMLVVDTRGTIVVVNVQTEQMFGYGRSELLGERVELLLLERASGGQIGYRSGHLANPHAREMRSELEAQGRRKDGSEFPVEVSLSSVQTEDGIVISASIRDMSERERLQALAGHLAAVVESSADAIISKAVDGKIVSWNPGAERLYGYTAAEAEGKSISMLVPDGHHDEVTNLVDRVVAGERVDHFETSCRCKDGTLVDVSLTISAVRDANGRLIGTSTIARDISERRHAEATLAQARKDIDRFFGLALDLMVIANDEGHFVRVNPAFEHILGYSPGELKARPFTDFIHPDDLQPTLDVYASQAEGQSVVGFENRYRCKDGSYRWLLWSATASEDGLIYATARDVTERKQIERSLQEAEEMLALAFEHSPVGMTLSTPGRQAVRINRAFGEMLGYSVEELLSNQDPTRITHRDDVGLDSQKLRFLLDGETSVARWEKRYIHADGHIVWALVSVSLLRHPDGTARHLIAQIEDISARKRLEDKLRTSREEALEASRLKSEFVANMSHEIRTPLNGVVCMSELLLDTGLSHEQREYAQVAMTSAEALMRVINDILDFSKIEAGKLEIVHEDFSIETILGEVCEIAGIKARENGVELVVSIDHDVPEVMRGDGNRMRQVLINLLGNAVKFTTEGEVLVHVDVKSTADGTETLRLEVTDTGIGIDRARLAHLFQPFSQGDATTTREYGGSGLGLCIAKQLVELMGGRIGVQSAPGEGSTFWFTVDCERGILDEGDVRSTDLTGIRVLIVDDHESNRQILQSQLARWGMRPDSADSGRAALESLHRAAEAGGPYEVALIDMRMPEMTGLELARQIKAAPRLRSTLLIMLSSSLDHSSEASAAGIDAELVKPVRQSRLYDQLVNSLSRAPRTFAAPARSEQALAPADAGSRVLVAEDNKINQFAATTVLKRLGFAVDVAVNGREAIEMTARQDYAAVFMDCQMPEIDGYAATAAIRRREGSNRRTPIIAMTANAMEGDRDRCLAAGMDDYLPKPLRLEAITALAASLTEPAPDGTPHASAEGRKQIGEALFDPAPLSDIGDLETETTLVAMFIDQATERLPELRAAIDTADGELLGKLAHGLKGSAATVGAIRIAELCGALCAHAGADTTPEASELHSELEATLRDTSNVMTAYIEEITP